MVQCQQCGTEIGNAHPRQKYCKICGPIHERERHHKYNIVHKKERKIKAKIYLQSVKEERQLKAKIYWSKNKEYFKEYYEQNKDRYKQQKKEYYKQNKEHIQQYKQLNKEKIALQTKLHRQLPEIKERNNKNHKKYMEKTQRFTKVSDLPFKGKPFVLFLIDVENFANVKNPITQQFKETLRKTGQKDFRSQLMLWLQQYLPKDQEYLFLWFGTFLDQTMTTDKTHHEIFKSTKAKTIDTMITAKAYEYLAKYPKQIAKIYLGSGDIDLYPIVEACLNQKKPCEILCNSLNEISNEYLKMTQLINKIHYLYP